MKIGVIGLGKVGLPLAVTMRHYGGHQVLGWDIDMERVHREMEHDHPHPERELRFLLADGGLGLALAPDAESVVKYSDVIFLVPPTPLPGFLGDRPVPNRLETFDLTTLIALFKETCATAERLQRHVTVVIVSTIGLNWVGGQEWFTDTEWVQVAYNPPFISLGQVVHDFTTQKFVLVGANTTAAAEIVAQVWTPVDNKIPILRMNIASAVIAKLAYNAVKTTRITLVNSLAILAQEHNANIDSIASVLHAAGEPHVQAGLGDGGACRIRDMVSLHWGMVGARAGDGFADAVIQTREEHADWVAAQVGAFAPDDKVTILGTTYKPGVPYEDGSPTLLVGGFLANSGVSVTYWDPLVRPNPLPPTQGTFLLAVPHTEILEWVLNKIEAGATVVDPSGALGAPGFRGHDELVGRGVTIIQPGRHW
jgi:UDPglucose 6-dehydrogenase